MTDKTSDDPQKSGADTHAFKMKVQPGSPPGLEVDGKGNVIPFAQRTAEDRAKSAATYSGDGIKNPEQEAEHPAPMPRDQQGQEGGRKDTDPAGEQGGQR